MSDQYAHAAARNNAEWCDAVCRSHGLPGEFDERAWTNARRTPPFYPDAVTLTPTASAAEVLARVDTSTPGCSVKDSFACLDLATDFEVLLDAWWIYRPVRPPSAPPPRHVRWVPVHDPDALRAWETAWGGGRAPAGLFRPELLLDRTVLVLAGYTGSRITAGVVANQSTSVIGISNLFTSDNDMDTDTDTDVDGAWSGALAAVAEHFPQVPIVGYEHGEALATALRHEFTPAGPLRVWRQAATSRLWQ